MSRCYPVTVVTAPQKLFLIEAAEMIDGEPVYGWRWDEGTGASNIACTVARTPMGQTARRRPTVANMRSAR